MRRMLDKTKAYDIPCLLCSEGIHGLGDSPEIRERVHATCAQWLMAKITPLPAMQALDAYDMPLPGMEELLSARGKRELQRLRNKLKPEQLSLEAI